MNAAKKGPFAEVRSVVAVDAPVPSAGAIVWWRLSGKVDFETFKAAWLGAGLAEDDLPSTCSATVALKRAVDDLREKRRLVRPLGRDGGFAVVKERVVGKSETTKHELEYDVLVKITLDEVGRVKLETVGASDDEVAKIGADVRKAFEEHLVTLDSTDFSHWLLKMMPKLDAVSLRDSGGVYFVPHTAMEKITSAVSVLRETTEHVVNRVPAMKSDDAVEAILDAITREAQSEADALQAVLEAGEMGERGLEARVERCDATESKVTRYEELLGRKLDTVRERLESLRANLTVAILKAQKGEEVG